MFRSIIIVFFFFLTTLSFGQKESYYKYIENKGQWPSQVGFKCQLENGDFYLEQNGFTYNFWDNSEISKLHENPNFEQIIKNNPPVCKGHVFKVNFLKNTFNNTFKKNGEAKEYHNYYLGKESKKWAGHCKLYNEIIYQNLYKGVKLKVYSNDFFLKYDLIIAPHTDPTIIQMKYEGMDNIQIEDDRLVVNLSVNTIIEQKPLAWQIIEGKKKFVKCNYKLDNETLSFEFPNKFDPNYEIIIDPELIFSTYSGSTSDNFGYTATYDSDGFLYSGSSAFGAGYPTTVGAYQVTWGGGVGAGNLSGTDIAITKYDTTGTFRVYSTFIGGSGDELPHSLVVDNNDQLFLYGTSSSDNFPTTINAFDTSFGGGIGFSPGGVGVDYENGSDIIVSKFNAEGSSLLSSTYIGGTANDGINSAPLLTFNYADEMRGEVLIDENQNVYVVSSTFSDDFPIVGGFQNNIAGGQDGCIIKMDSNLENIIWSSFLGGNSNDAAYAIALDSNNDILISGGTESTNLSIPLGAIQTSNNGGDADGYVIKINQNGSGIISGTYFGSNAYDQLYFVEVDQDNNVYVYGQTRATNNYFINNAMYNQPNSGMLVAKLNPTLTNIEWSTVFGTGSGKPNLSPTAFLIDNCNRVYMSGWGGSTNYFSSGQQADYVTGMETTPDAYQSTTDGSDFYILVIQSDASEIIYASFFGGDQSSEHVDGGTSRFSPDGTIYQSVCAGCGSNSDFPIYPSNAVSPTNNSPNCNNAVFKMKFDIPEVEANFDIPSNYCFQSPLTMTNMSQFGTEYNWNFGDGTLESSEENPTHIFPDTGTFSIQLITFNSLCNVTDTSFQEINIVSPQLNTLSEVNICQGETTSIGPETTYPNYDYLWSPIDNLSSSTVGNPTVTLQEDANYTLVIHHDGCIDTLFQQVNLYEPSLSLPEDYVLCESQFIDVTATSSSGTTINWYDSPDLTNSIATGDQLNIFIEENTSLYATATIQECIAIDTFEVSLLSQSVQITPSFTSCANDTIFLEVINPNNQLTYHWTPENQILFGQNTSQISSVLQQQTLYTVLANYNNLCSVTDQVVVSVSGVNSNQIITTATPTNVLAGQEVQLTAMPNGYLYSWSPAESLDNSTSQTPIATPEENTVYNVQILDGNCVYTSSVQVKVYDFVCGNPTIYVPNAFTPNDNDENEKIWVRGKNLTSIYFVIYDRWGEKIFETRDQNLGWDGTYEGEELDPAVFVYYLEAVCSDGQEYFEKGNITLIR